MNDFTNYDPDPIGWETIPVECKAEFQRAMRRHPAGSARGVVVPFPVPADRSSAPRGGVLDTSGRIGTFIAMSTLAGMGILLFVLYFGLVKP